jgi:hypothetical protein
LGVALFTGIAYAIGQMLDGKMHQTTVRFGPDLWQAMESECARLGVSAAQYLREAALARLAYTGGRAGFPAYEIALAKAQAGSDVADVPAGAYRDRAPARELGHRPADLRSAERVPS